MKTKKTNTATTAKSNTEKWKPTHYYIQQRKVPNAPENQSTCNFLISDLEHLSLSSGKGFDIGFGDLAINVELLDAMRLLSYGAQEFKAKKNWATDFDVTDINYKQALIYLAHYISGFTMDNKERAAMYERLLTNPKVRIAIVNEEMLAKVKAMGLIKGPEFKEVKAEDVTVGSLVQHTYLTHKTPVDEVVVSIEPTTGGRLIFNFLNEDNGYTVYEKDELVKAIINKRKAQPFLDVIGSNPKVYKTLSISQIIRMQEFPDDYTSDRKTAKQARRKK